MISAYQGICGEAPDALSLALGASGYAMRSQHSIAKETPFGIVVYRQARGGSVVLRPFVDVVDTERHGIGDGFRCLRPDEFDEQSSTSCSGRADARFLTH